MPTPNLISKQRKCWTSSLIPRPSILSCYSRTIGYGRDPEKVLEALLEGTAMSEEELECDLRVKEELERKYSDGAAGNEVEYRVVQRRMSRLISPGIEWARKTQGLSSLPSVNTLAETDNFEIQRDPSRSHLYRRDES
jgi:hypothetical protein